MEVSRGMLFPVTSSFHFQLLHVIAQEGKRYLPEILQFSSQDVNEEASFARADAVHPPNPTLS